MEKFYNLEARSKLFAIPHTPFWVDHQMPAVKLSCFTIIFAVALSDFFLQ